MLPKLSAAPRDSLQTEYHDAELYKFIDLYKLYQSINRLVTNFNLNTKFEAKLLRMAQRRNCLLKGIALARRKLHVLLLAKPSKTL